MVQYIFSQAAEKYKIKLLTNVDNPKFGRIIPFIFQVLFFVEELYHASYSQFRYYECVGNANWPNKTDEKWNAVCITPTPSYVCWLLCDFSNHCEDIRLDDGPNFF